MILLFFQLSFGNAGRTSSGGFPVFVSLVLSEEMFHNLKMSHPVVRGNVPQPQNVTPLMQIYQQT